MEDITIIPVRPGETVTPPEPLPLADIRKIHAGLMLPNREAAMRMAREILEARGVPNPDEI